MKEKTRGDTAAKKRVKRTKKVEEIRWCSYWPEKYMREIGCVEIYSPPSALAVQYVQEAETALRNSRRAHLK